MSIELIRNFLLWCAIINYGVLMVWFVAFLIAHDWMYRLHNKWFRLSVERFDEVHYGLMGFYKLGILLLNLVPYFALRIVG